MTSIEAVRQLARTAHADQRDKQGRDYVEHHLAPIAEHLREHGEHAEMAGWLHDIVEDTPTTLTDLLEHGIPPEVVRAVDAVTRREGESYDDLITRAAADPLGRVVKIADNETNMSANAALAQTDPELAERLRKKYQRARTQLDHHPSALFVVHGRIESLTHDVAIIPTDAAVRVEETWDRLAPSGVAAPRTLTDGWVRWGDSPAWLIDVTAHDFTTVLDSLRAALHDIAEQQPWRTDPTTGVYGSAVPLGGRPLPLVALPVLGIGRGGRQAERGTVLDVLVPALLAELQVLPFDIALVTPDPAVHAAAQHARRTHLPALADGDDATQQLVDAVKSGDMALFLGAGVSIPAGLPTWRDLVDELASTLEPADQAVLADMEITDKAQLIERLQPDGFQERVAEITRRATRPSLVHTLLAGLDVANVVTTNYDELFEQAMAAAGHRADVVLPHQSARGQQRWVLKMHGDVRHTSGIVLTRRHMVMYDAGNRPSAALLQSLLLTKHLLVVGASMTDPNVVRLTHEVDEYRRTHGQQPLDAYGTVLDVGPSSPAQQRLWEDQLTWVDLSVLGVGSGSRALEILLDRVGMYASRDSSWLLDRRFSGLLDESQRELADRVRDLAADLPDDPIWSVLRESLASLGLTSAKVGTPSSDR